MIFAWDIDVPAATPVSNPVEKILKLHRGVIVKVYIKFPAGCHGLVGVRIYRWGQQLIPLNRDDWLTGDDETVPCEIYYPLETHPYELKFIAVSPLCTYDHKITVRVIILNKFLAYPYLIIDRFINLFKRIFGA